MGYRQNSEPIIGRNGLSGRLYFPAGSARPQSVKKSPHLYLAKKHGGVRQKRTVLQNIFPGRLCPTAIPWKVPSLIPGKNTGGCPKELDVWKKYISNGFHRPSFKKTLSNYMWQKNRRVFGVKRPFWQNIFIWIVQPTVLFKSEHKKKECSIIALFLDPVVLSFILCKRGYSFSATSYNCYWCAIINRLMQLVLAC